MRPLRIMVLRPGPHFSVMDVHRGWFRALRRAGHDVMDVNFDERIGFYHDAHVQREGEWVKAVDQNSAIRMANASVRGAVYDFLPDVIVVISAFFVSDLTLDLVRARGSKVVIVHTESPYEDDRQVERAAHADLNLVNDPTNLARFVEAVGADNVYYQPHCYDPEVHWPRPPRDDCRSDFVFVGTGFPSRVEFLEQVSWDGIDVALAGNWTATDEGSPLRPFVAHKIDHCIDNTDAVDLYCSAKVSANLYRREANESESAAGWAMGPREVELAACGTFFLRDPRPEGDELFPMLPTFAGPDEFGEQLRWWLGHGASRIAASRDARAAIADRTFDAAARHLIIERLGYSPVAAHPVSVPA